jgi:hypothetical protein
MPDIYLPILKGRLLAALGYRLEPVSGQSVEQSTELICRGRQGG